MTRLTIPRLRALQSALNAALAGEGFNEGDFDGENIEHFNGALNWVCQEIDRRLERLGKRKKT